jgi:hypothetical protein
VVGFWKLWLVEMSFKELLDAARVLFGLLVIILPELNEFVGVNGFILACS